MANNVGNISIGLSLDNQTFEAVLSGSASRLRRFEGDVTRSGIAAAAASGGMNQLGGSLSKLGPLMSQASFGAGDFVSQLSTRGLGGGLQAAANNVQQLGAAFGPMGLAISAGIGVAVTALGVYIEQSDRAAKRTKALADESAAAWKKIAADAERGAAEQRNAIRKNQGEIADIAAGKDQPQTRDELRSRIQQEEKRLAELNREKAALQAELNRALPFGISAQAPGGRFAQNAGVEIPGRGVVAVGDATLNTGPLTMRALGPTANATRIDPRTGQRGPLFNKAAIEQIGNIEQKLISVNEELRAATLRGEELARQEPQLVRNDRLEAERQRRIEELAATTKGESQISKEMDKDKEALDRKADSLTKSVETTFERMQRQIAEVTTLERAGALSAESADMLRQRFEQQANRQPNTLQTFSAGSQETLSAINRIIRGSRDSKVVEKNTAETVNALKEQTREVKNGFARQQRVRVARF